jgi:hypothetical protein
MLNRTIYISRNTAERIGQTLKACGTIARYRVYEATGKHADRSGYQGHILVVWDANGRKFNA